MAKSTGWTQPSFDHLAVLVATIRDICLNGTHRRVIAFHSHTRLNNRQTGVGGPLVCTRVPTATAPREMVDRWRAALGHARRSLDRTDYRPLLRRNHYAVFRSNRGWRRARAGIPGSSARRAEGPGVCPTNSQRPSAERGQERHDGPCRNGCGPVPASAITVQSSAGNPTLIVKVPIRPLNAPRRWPIQSPRRPPT